jgi:hypothetical protein
MSPKEFQKYNLAIELRGGKKRLEVAPHGLSDEQWETAGRTAADQSIQARSIKGKVNRKTSPATGRSGNVRGAFQPISC